MATPLPHSRNALPDAQLARLAAGGDGEAFAALYDRHEQRVHGFCMRLLCSSHDAAEATQETFVRMLARLPALQDKEVNFIAYTLAAARNACYDMIAARRTVQPTAEQIEPAGPREAQPGTLERDPERRALLEAQRAQVRAANAALPERQREVLALREVEGLSYEQIGELMGLNRNAVAQLISRARIKLHALVRGGALASVGVAAPECERALPLLAALQDGEDKEGEEGQRAWLQLHLARCERCRTGRAAMEEAGVSYRALGPIVAAAWLRRATIARAAESVGADWSQVAARSAHAAWDGGSAAGVPGGSAAPGGGTDGVIAAGTDAGSSHGARGGRLAAVSRWLHPRERPGRAAGVALGLLLCAIVALVAAGGVTRERALHTHTLTLVSPPAAPARTPATVATVPARRPRLVQHRGAVGPPSPAHRPARSLTVARPQVRATTHPRHRRAAAHHRPARHKAQPQHKQPAPVAPTPPATTPTQPATTTTAPPTTTPTTTTPTTTTETTETTKRPEEPPVGTPRGPAGGPTGGSSGGGAIP